MVKMCEGRKSCIQDPWSAAVPNLNFQTVCSKLNRGHNSIDVCSSIVVVVFHDVLCAVIAHIRLVPSHWRPLDPQGAFPMNSWTLRLLLLAAPVTSQLWEQLRKRFSHTESPQEPFHFNASEDPLHSAWYPQRIHSQRVVEDFQYAYDAYMWNAWPKGELQPLTCTGTSFDLVRLDGLTLIDSLDTLLLMENYTEFARSIERLRSIWTLEVDQNVSVFETTIRVVGGLVSAHQLAEAFLPFVPHSDVWDSHGDVRWDSVELRDMPNATEPYKYDGCLLDWAWQVADRLYPAFDTPTGIPYGTVHLQYGVPQGETPIASLAGGGTLVLEFETLSRLTGDSRFGRAARCASRALWMRRTPLLGKHIHIGSGSWTEPLAGIGSNSDSFYEYLAKASFLWFEQDDFWLQFVATYDAVHEHLKVGDWYADADWKHNQRQIFESLMAFYPGLQVLLGEMGPAARTLNSFFVVRQLLGFLPERFHWGNWRVDFGGGKHPLRPELLESAYYMHMATKNPETGFSGWQIASAMSLLKLHQLARTHCGYASLNDVKPTTTGSMAGESLHGVRHLNEMPSFFLSETLKYLFLTFEDENLLHRDIDHEWVFTTEAHPVHYVAAVSSVDSQLEQNIAHLKAILQRKLTGDDRLFDFHPDLKLDKWAERTEADPFTIDIHSTAVKSKRFRSTATRHGLISSLVGKENFEGASHLIPDPSGQRGYELCRACLNLQSTAFLWMTVLGGGVLDYAKVHRPSTMKDAIVNYPHWRLRFWEALQAHSSGVYPDHSTDAHHYCFFGKNASSSGDAVMPDHPGPGSESDPTAFDSKLGSFEVSTFPGGGGFHVHHIESGERIVTTFLHDDQDASQSIIMTFSSIPMGPVDREVDTDSTTVDASLTRRLVLTDQADNSFECEVSILRKHVGSLHENSDVETLMVIPCAPALFGPTSMAQLLKYGGIQVDAILVKPDPTDPMGCAPIAEETCSNEEDKYGDIHMTNRGGCTFFLKSLGHKKYGASGLIVINTDPDELFVMSNAPEESLSVPPQDLPPTVLVTGRDGEALLSTWSGEERLFARIQIERRHNENLEGLGKLEDPVPNTAFPYVMAEQHSVKVLASGGWGVMATRGLDNQEWKLDLLQHDFIAS